MTVALWDDFDGRQWRLLKCRTSMSIDISRPHVKWITLYNDKFWVFPEFIITPSLVVSLSTTTAANDDGSGVCIVVRSFDVLSVYKCHCAMALRQPESYWKVGIVLAPSSGGSKISNTWGTRRLGGVVWEWGVPCASSTKKFLFDFVSQIGEFWCKLGIILYSPVIA